MRRIIVRSIVAVLAIGVLALIVAQRRADTNYERFNAWAAHKIDGPITEVVFRNGGRTARCRDAQLVRALSVPLRDELPAARGERPRRFETAEVHFRDGTTIQCDGGVIGPTAVSFEVEDRLTTCDWDGADPLKVADLMTFLFGDDGAREQSF